MCIGSTHLQSARRASLNHWMRTLLLPCLLLAAPGCDNSTGSDKNGGGGGDSGTGSGTEEVFISVDVSCDASTGDYHYSAQTVSGVDWVSVNTNASHGGGIELDQGHEFSEDGDGSWSLVSGPNEDNSSHHDCVDFDTLTHTFKASMNSELTLETLEPT